MNSLLQSYWEKLPEMEGRFLASTGEYASLRKSILPQITSQEWCASPRYDLDPMGIVLSDWGKPGRAYRTFPKRHQCRYQYGIGDDGLWLYEQQFTTFEGQAYEQFVVRGGQEVYGYLYSYQLEKPAINVESLVMQDGKPVAFLRYAQYGCSVSVFEYAGEKICAYWEAEKWHKPIGSHGSLKVSRYYLEYGENGKIHSVFTKNEQGVRQYWVQGGKRL